jgi:hypothetical protein
LEGFLKKNHCPSLTQYLDPSHPSFWVIEEEYFGLIDELLGLPLLAA